MTKVHVVGAGLAGLACGLSAATTGVRVIIYEAAAAAGGRCRSFHDPVLGTEIDNGSHLVLGANRATFAYLKDAGGPGLDEIEPASFAFLDLRDGRAWRLHPNPGFPPWWPLAPGRRAPGTRARDYLAPLSMMWAGPAATVADFLRRDGVAIELVWEPVCVAVMNAWPREAAASVFGPALASIFGFRGRSARPHVPGRGLSASFIDPALATLARRGATVRFHARLRSIERTGGAATALRFDSETVTLRPGDGVVLAVPPREAALIVPDVRIPAESRAIVNTTFRLGSPATLPDGARFLGLIGGHAQWLFARGDLLTATVGAADALVDRPAGDIASLLWCDAARVLGVSSEPPPNRVVKERRATMAQTPDQQRLRPGARTALSNLFLAGDWTDTGLPATIEGAIRSGRRAARLALALSGVVRSPPRR